MPFAINSGIQIYYEVVGEGEPIIFHNGAGNCVQDWYGMGYVDALKNHFQLILIDTRGHGKSSKTHNPDLYALDLIASDTISVIKDLKLDRAHCFGYSLGGRIVFALMKYYPQYFDSYIIGGMHPYGSTNMGNLFYEWLTKGMPFFIGQMEKMFRPFPATIRHYYFDNDAEALAALYKLPFPDLSDGLTNITAPCLLYAGSNDSVLPQVEQCAKLIKGGKLRILDKMDHFQTFWNHPKTIAELILDFLC